MRSLVLWIVAIGFALAVHLGALSLIVPSLEQGTDDIDTDGSFDRAISLTLVEDAGQGTAGTDADRIAGKQTETPVNNPSETETALSTEPEKQTTEVPAPPTGNNGSEVVSEETENRTSTRTSEDRTEPAEAPVSATTENNPTDETSDQPADAAAVDRASEQSNPVSSSSRLKKQTAEPNRQSDLPIKKPTKPVPQDATDNPVPANKSKAASEPPKEAPAAKPQEKRDQSRAENTKRNVRKHATNDKPQRGGNAKQTTSRGTTGNAKTAASRANKGQLKSYSRKLRQWIERHKRYPKKARDRGITGVGTLRITIDRSGRVLKSALIKSTGDSILDTALRNLPKRASPFPPMPKDLSGSRLTFNVPVRFKRRGT